jgi:hypothetical protein
MKEISEIEMCENLIYDNKVELAKSRIMDRLHQRMLLSGERGVKELMAMNQSKIRTLEQMLKHLTDIHSALLEEREKKVDNEATKT